MKCLRKYKWVKLPRKEMPELKGRLGYWLKLAESAAFRKGIGTYCGHKNPVEPGMWAGGIVSYSWCQKPCNGLSDIRPAADTGLPDLYSGS